MNINLSETYSPELEAAIHETEPFDFPAGDLLHPWEAGELHFLTARDAVGKLLGVLAYQINKAPQGLSMEIVGVNAKRTPLALRMMFQALCSSADEKAARLCCMIEKAAMARIAERYGMKERSRFFVRELS